MTCAMPLIPIVASFVVMVTPHAWCANFKKESVSNKTAIRRGPQVILGASHAGAVRAKCSDEIARLFNDDDSAEERSHALFGMKRARQSALPVGAVALFGCCRHRSRPSRRCGVCCGPS